MSGHLIKETEQLQNAEFLQDVADFFAMRRSGHLSKWLYSNPKFEGDKACGVDAWEKVARAARNGDAYYVFRAEKAIIDKGGFTSALVSRFR
jgi:hypothetical protein